MMHSPGQADHGSGKRLRRAVSAVDAADAPDLSVEVEDAEGPGGSGSATTESALRMVQARLRTHGARLRAKLDKLESNVDGAAPIEDVLDVVRQVARLAQPPLSLSAAAIEALREVALLGSGGEVAEGHAAGSMLPAEAPWPPPVERVDVRRFANALWTVEYSPVWVSSEVERDLAGGSSMTASRLHPLALHRKHSSHWLVSSDALVGDCSDHDLQRDLGASLEDASPPKWLVWEGVPHAYGGRAVIDKIRNVLAGKQGRVVDLLAAWDKDGDVRGRTHSPHAPASFLTRRLDHPCPRIVPSSPQPWPLLRAAWIRGPSAARHCAHA